MFEIIVLILLLVFYSNTGYESIYLYDTEDGLPSERFHCIYHGIDNIPYCRRTPLEEVIVNQSSVNFCFNGGQQMNFSTLMNLDVKPDDAVKWSSSIEKLDDYAAFYYYNKLNLTFIESDSFLCDCSKLQTGKTTFGKFCEYQLLFNLDTINDALQIQFNHKISHWFLNQMYGDILCYTSITCDYGLLCLEWRNICDGFQNCNDGWDELNCDILEFNECADDQYRCADGLCIPDLYFLDGKNQEGNSELEVEKYGKVLYLN
jgi:hypothetical protein